MQLISNSNGKAELMLLKIPSQNSYHISYNYYLISNTLLAKALKTALAASKLLLIVAQHQHRGTMLKSAFV